MPSPWQLVDVANDLSDWVVDALRTFGDVRSVNTAMLEGKSGEPAARVIHEKRESMKPENQRQNYDDLPPETRGQLVALAAQLAATLNNLPPVGGVTANPSKVLRGS